MYVHTTIVLFAICFSTCRAFEQPVAGAVGADLNSCSEESNTGKGRYHPMLGVNHWRACGDGDAGEPLFLTQFLKNGSVEKAVELSRVTGISNLTSFSGFLTVNEKLSSNMFFWFFPAQTDPENAPVLLWLQGGPGASSLFGMFVEIGPLMATEAGEFVNMPVTWNSKYSLLFIDNPVGTGFSFTQSDAGYATNQAEVARDLYAGLTQFFSIFTQYQKNDFYVTGESYAGKYCPSISQRIIEGNRAGDGVHINFRGMAIGDGWIDPITMTPVYPDLLQQMSAIDAAQAEEAAGIMQKIELAIMSGNYREAFELGDSFLLGTMYPYPTWLTNNTGSTNHYNILHTTVPDKENYYLKPLVQDSVRRALHVGNLPYSSSQAVARHLLADVYNTSLPALRAVLAADAAKYKVMLYNGQFDIVVGNQLTEAMCRQMDWAGKREFFAAERKVWRMGKTADAEIAGYVKTVRNLHQAVVRGCGHMVPMDEPERALDLISRFIDDVPF
ncbi:probable serine carboxypeptidase CPVL [Sycon ciliatum]|uniref:probable serine carboxypeptidase CPVL n=1 Tax=Sycon ciliatum TaxID=27933 RepID=UPI0020AAF99A|eukprot:scpid82232/ scgid12325/ Probable serine carboxypeptidase CPVL; Carboxypeptidase, vitellogenic-like; Vitellogenic carboxypeptidase-like protein